MNLLFLSMQEIPGNVSGTMSVMGTLHVVATPIGNRQDITFRALRTLFSVDLVLAEDTRKTGQLLALYEQEEPYRRFLQTFNAKKPKLFSFYDEIEEQRISEVITLLEEGQSVAIVSDAGTPLISDPGFKLVRQCYRKGIPVSPIPGPSSVTAALSASGLPTDRFLYLGYLPVKEGKKTSLLTEMKKLKADGVVKTILFLESPYRIEKTLATLRDVMGNIDIVVAREMTKIHEEFFSGSVATAIGHFQDPKGEFVILISL